MSGMGDHSFEVTWTYVVPPANYVRVKISQRQDGPFRMDAIGGRGQYHVSIEQLQLATSSWRHVTGSTHAITLPNYQRASQVAEALWERERDEQRGPA